MVFVLEFSFQLFFLYCISVHISILLLLFFNQFINRSFSTVYFFLFGFDIFTIEFTGRMFLS